MVLGKWIIDQNKKYMKVNGKMGKEMDMVNNIFKMVLI